MEPEEDAKKRSDQGTILQAERSRVREPLWRIKFFWTELHGLIPWTNYTDLATDACQR
jgi:hypothetical protein